MQVFELSTKIKELCKANKISVKLLLEKCDINRNFIYDLERNGQIPSFDKIIKIANYLNCSIDYLAGRTDNPDIYTQKGSNKMTFYQRIEKVCSDNNISIEKIDVSDDIEIHSCVYPHVDVFYRIYNQLEEILKDNKVYVHLFDEIYGGGATDKMYNRMRDYIAQNHINTTSYLHILYECEKFKEILPKEILENLTVSSNENEQIINMERILYGTSSDSTQPKFSLADNPEEAEIPSAARKEQQDPNINTFMQS